MLFGGGTNCTVGTSHTNTQCSIVVLPSGKGKCREIPIPNLLVCGVCFLATKPWTPVFGWPRRYRLNFWGFENSFVTLGRASRFVIVAKLHCPCPAFRHHCPCRLTFFAFILETYGRVLGSPAQMGYHLFPLVVSATAVRRESSHWVINPFHHTVLYLTTTLVLESHGWPGRVVAMGYKK